MSGQTFRLSAVHRGAAFEQRSLQLLSTHFSMALRRVGGRSDGGIDLVGWWWLPVAAEHDDAGRTAALPDTDGLLRRRLRVLAQCKAEKKKFSPKYVREMEGVWHLRSRSSTLALPSSSLADEPAASDGFPTVALLLSESPFSQSTVLHVYRSTVPFLLIHLPCSSSSPQSSTTPSSAGDTEICTVYPNPTLAHLVKPVAFCWERSPSSGSSTAKVAFFGGRPGLWWHGRKLGSWAPDSPCSEVA